MHGAFLDTTILSMIQTLPISKEYIDTMHNIFVCVEKRQQLQKMEAKPQNIPIKAGLEYYQQELRLFLYGQIGSSTTAELLGLETS